VSKNFERWKELATLTSKEQDSAKLTELAKEMNLVLTQKTPYLDAPLRVPAERSNEESHSTTFWRQLLEVKYVSLNLRLKMDGGRMVELDPRRHLHLDHDQPLQPGTDCRPCPDSRRHRVGR
jgi:hypothetical protein